MILITGAAGSVGRALCAALKDAGRLHKPSDIHGLPYFVDVTDYGQVQQAMARWQPRVVFHLAGWKQAPEGELDPLTCTAVNAAGTSNVVQAAGRFGAKVILSSTCKACDPETAYGASKLISERLVLNGGGVVVRFFNIPESDANVFRLWELIPQNEPIPYTDCWRFFVSMERSVGLLIRAMDLPTGRYAPEPGAPRSMREMAEELYPGRKLIEMPRRRGDRPVEPMQAACELIERVGDDCMRVESPYDPAETLTMGGGRWAASESAAA